MKKKISVCYSCSDVMQHEHKTKIGAWLCGRWQAFLFSQLSRLTKRVPDGAYCPACHSLNAFYAVVCVDCGAHTAPRR